MKRLAGRTALVTGGAQGIGRGIALALASEGADVALADVEATLVEEAAGIVAERGVDARGYGCDVADRSQVDETVGTVADRFGRIDVLVNCAQRRVANVPLESVTTEMLERSWQSGFLGTLACMQACFPHLRARGGCVINVGSGAGVEGLAGYAVYGPVKEAIRCLSKVAAREWGRHGIRVNVLCPHAATAPWERFAHDHPDRAAALLAGNALGWGPADPERHVGAAAVFLASADADYVTGHTLFVDGGLTLR